MIIKIKLYRDVPSPFYLFLVVYVLLDESLVVPLEVLNADLKLLVNAQPGVVHFPQGGRLFGEILPTYQTVGHYQFVQVETDGLFVSLLKIRPFGQIFDGIHYYCHALYIEIFTSITAISSRCRARAETEKCV